MISSTQLLLSVYLVNSASWIKFVCCDFYNIHNSYKGSLSVKYVSLRFPLFTKFSYMCIIIHVTSKSTTLHSSVSLTSVLLLYTCHKDINTFKICDKHCSGIYSQCDEYMGVLYSFSRVFLFVLFLSIIR